MKNKELNNRPFGYRTFGEWKEFFKKMTGSELMLNEQVIRDLVDMVECLASEAEVVRRFQQMCEESLPSHHYNDFIDKILAQLQHNRKALQEQPQPGKEFDYIAKRVKQLKADYKPIPGKSEVVECEVYIGKIGKIYGRLVYDDPDFGTKFLSQAVDNPNFIEEKYADGVLRCTARKCTSNISIAEIPTHVRFLQRWTNESIRANQVTPE